jgi:hypothetical protein
VRHTSPASGPGRVRWLAVLAIAVMLGCSTTIGEAPDRTAMESAPPPSVTAAPSPGPIHSSPTHARPTASARPSGLGTPSAAVTAVPPTIEVTPPPDVPGEWRSVPRAPVEGRWHHRAIWTGEEMIIWGGQPSTEPGYFADGAAYSPAGDAWRMLADAPIAGRVGHDAVWTGTEVIVWGGRAGPQVRYADGAAYNPATDAWRLLAEAPLEARAGHRAVWTGAEVIIWGGSTPVGSPSVEAAAYNPSTDAWRQLPRSPLPSGNAGVAWTGQELVVISYEGSAAAGAAYDAASDTWRDLAPSIMSSLWAGPAIWTESEIVMLSSKPWSGRGLSPGAAYDPASDTWRTVSSPPGGGFAVIEPVWTGFEVIIYGYRPVAYHPASDTWRRLTAPHPPPGREGHTVIWTGAEMIAWGGTGGGSESAFARADGIAFLP